MLPHSIHQAFDRYDKLVDLHIKETRDIGTRLNFRRMQFERARVFSDLKNQLSHFFKRSEKDRNGLKDAAED